VPIVKLLDCGARGNFAHCTSSTVRLAMPIRQTLFAALALLASLTTGLGHAAEINLATLTCGRYENEVLPAAAADPTADTINTVMWLFGYSVAKAGGHVLFTDALAPFGFALDGECKTNPRENLLDALAAVKIDSKSPMDLSTVECGAFASRHAEFARSDVESATTIMMWLFGFSVAASGSHVFDANLLDPFAAALLSDCQKHPDRFLLDALKAVKPAKLAPAPKAPPK
jgi:hypothetical protein